MIEEEVDPPYSEIVKKESYLWTLITCKGYTGGESEIWAVIPTKRPQNSGLSLEQRERNQSTPSDRVIVEHVYGELCTF